MSEVLYENDEVFLYNIPVGHLEQHRSLHRAKDWDLANPDGTFKLVVIASPPDPHSSERSCHLQLKDVDEGLLYGQSVIDYFHKINPSKQAIKQIVVDNSKVSNFATISTVADSTRYFTLFVQNQSGEHELVGLGFSSRDEGAELSNALEAYFEPRKSGGNSQQNVISRLQQLSGTVSSNTSASAKMENPLKQQKQNPPENNPGKKSGKSEGLKFKFTCGVGDCNRSFRTKSALTEHTGAKHGPNQSQGQNGAKGQNSTASKPKPAKLLPPLQMRLPPRPGLLPLPTPVPLFSISPHPPSTLIRRNTPPDQYFGGQGHGHGHGNMEHREWKRDGGRAWAALPQRREPREATPRGPSFSEWLAMREVGERSAVNMDVDMDMDINPYDQTYRPSVEFQRRWQGQVHGQPHPGQYQCQKLDQMMLGQIQDQGQNQNQFQDHQVYYQGQNVVQMQDPHQQPQGHHQMQSPNQHQFQDQGQSQGPMLMLMHIQNQNQGQQSQTVPIQSSAVALEARPQSQPQSGQKSAGKSKKSRVTRNRQKPFEGGLPYKVKHNTFQCHWCPSTVFLADSEKSLAVHWDEAHGLKKPILCRMCDLIFSSESELEKHTKVSHEFLCPICQVKFPFEKSLNVHIKRIHE